MKPTEKTLEAFEMEAYGRIFRISWRDRVTHDEVIRKLREKRK